MMVVDKDFQKVLYATELSTDLYEEVLNNVKEDLKEMQSLQNEIKGIHKVKCHFTTKDFVLKQLTLACCPFPENHSCEIYQSTWYLMVDSTLLKLLGSLNGIAFHVLPIHLILLLRIL